MLLELSAESCRWALSPFPVWLSLIRDIISGKVHCCGIFIFFVNDVKLNSITFIYLGWREKSYLQEISTTAKINILAPIWGKCKLNWWRNWIQVEKRGRETQVKRFRRTNKRTEEERRRGGGWGTIGTEKGWQDTGETNRSRADRHKRQDRQEGKPRRTSESDETTQEINRGMDLRFKVGKKRSNTSNKRERSRNSNP